MKSFIFLLILFPANLYATTHLCVGETGAGDFKSKVYAVSNQKLVLSNDSGEWLLKKTDQDYPKFD